MNSIAGYVTERHITELKQSEGLFMRKDTLIPIKISSKNELSYI